MIPDVDESPSQPERIVGRYAIFGRIGSGGMGAVHLGRPLEPCGFSPPVAIKCVHASHADEPEFRTMLIDEARLSARVRHPNVIPTLDIVVEDDEVLLVMEYVAGEPLGRLLADAVRREEPVPCPIAARIAVDILLGLQAAHDATDPHGSPLHLVHRDVSPQNALVGVDGRTRLLDFGVAKARGRLHSTRDGQLKGKLAYMSPEQIRGSAVPQSDVFSASAVLWESLTGRRLFAADNEGATLNLLLNAPIPRPSEFRVGIAVALEAVVLRGLSRDLHERFARAADMADALSCASEVAEHQAVADWVRGLAAERLDASEKVTLSIARTPADLLCSRLAEPDRGARESTEPVAQDDLHNGPTRAWPAPQAPAAPTAQHEPGSPPVRQRFPWPAMAVGGALVAATLLGIGWMSSTATEPGPPGNALQVNQDANGEAADMGVEIAASSALVAASVIVPAEMPPATSSVRPFPQAPGSASARLPNLPAPPTSSTGTVSTLPAGPGATPSSTATGRPGCEQPSYIDDSGIKRYKVECL